MNLEMTVKQKKITIVHLITGLTTAGAEIMLYNLLSRTDRRVFDPVVVSLMDRGTLSDRIEALDIPVYTIGMKPGGVPTPTIVLRLLKTMNQLKPDLIHGWMYHGNLAAWVASIFSFRRIPIIWNIHHSISGLANEKKNTQNIIKLSSIISRFIDSVVFVSNNSKSQHESLGYFPENACVIPNGFNTVNFYPSEEARLKIRDELDLPSDTFLIGLICRYHPMKDHKNFLQAAAILQKKYPKVHFILAGRDVDENNVELLSMIKELELSNIHLLGERRDIPTITAALDITSSSSAYGEAFPMITGEAMSCCVPCVVTDVGDSAWIVGDTGKVVPPQNSQALANAWNDLIAMSEKDRKVLGTSARNRVVEKFSLESIVARFEHLYKKIVTEA